MVLIWFSFVFALFEFVLNNAAKFVEEFFPIFLVILWLDCGYVGGFEKGGDLLGWQCIFVVDVWALSDLCKFFESFLRAGANTALVASLCLIFAFVLVMKDGAAFVGQKNRGFVSHVGVYVNVEV